MILIKGYACTRVHIQVLNLGLEDLWIDLLF
jgi:hypothetical protein